jgi:gliding motility-associated-like protein
VIDVVPQSVVACEKAILNFMDNSTTNAGASYHWTFGDGASSSSVNPNHDYTASGIYNVIVVVTSPFGCVNTANTTCSVVVNPGTVALFTSEAKDGTLISPSYQFNNASTNAASHYWTFGDGNTSTSVNPQHTYTDKGMYTVTLLTITTAGCRDSVSMPVEIIPVFTLFIPNAFTPDGNGNNDYFTAKGIEINEFNMMIFNRWGELIFQSDDIAKGWDGKANNGSKTAENGVYIYKIAVRDFQEKYHDYTGHVTLLASE